MRRMAAAVAPSSPVDAIDVLSLDSSKPWKAAKHSKGVVPETRKGSSCAKYRYFCFCGSVQL